MRMPIRSQSKQILVARDIQLSVRFDSALQDAVIIWIAAHACDFTRHHNVYGLAQKWTKPLLNQFAIAPEFMVKNAQDFLFDVGADGKVVDQEYPLQSNGSTAELNCGDPDSRIDDYDHLRRPRLGWVFSARTSWTKRSTFSGV